MLDETVKSSVSFGGLFSKNNPPLFGKQFITLRTIRAQFFCNKTHAFFKDRMAHQTFANIAPQ